MAGRPTRETNPRHTPGRPVHAAPAVPILTIAEVAELLRVSTATVERFVYRSGIPYLDLSTHRPGRRLKRLLRFERDAVLTWARTRTENGNPSW